MAGNHVIVNSDGVTFDTTPPVISGITDGQTYYTSQKVNVTDADLDRVVVNDADFASGSSLSGDKEATYTIVATDKAGNSTTYTISMKPISDLSDPMDDISEEDVKPDDRETIEEIKKRAEAVDRVNATPAEKQALQDIIDRCDLLLKQLAANEKPAQPPQTGDTGSMPLWIALLFVSGGLTAYGVSKKRKKASSK